MSLTAGSFYARPEGYTDDDAIQLLKRTFELGITVRTASEYCAKLFCFLAWT